jgi:hypothetical protein
MITPGALLAYKSRWPKEGQIRPNLNILHVPQKADMDQSTSVHAAEVTVSLIG